jgi:hypothetical protein
MGKSDAATAIAGVFAKEDEWQFELHAVHNLLLLLLLLLLLRIAGSGWLWMVGLEACQLNGL